MECKVCGKKEGEVVLFQGILDRNIEDICENCAMTEGVPLIKRSAQSHENSNVETKIASLRPGSRDPFMTHQSLARLSLPQKREDHPDLVDNYDWVLKAARRRKKISPTILSEELIIPLPIILDLEAGKIPKDFKKYIGSLEKYLEVKLARENAPVNNIQIRDDSDKNAKDLLDSVKRNMNSKPRSNNPKTNGIVDLDNEEDLKKWTLRKIATRIFGRRKKQNEEKPVTLEIYEGTKKPVQRVVPPIISPTKKEIKDSEKKVVKEKKIISENYSQKPVHEKDNNSKFKPIKADYNFQPKRTENIPKIPSLNLPKVEKIKPKEELKPKEEKIITPEQRFEKVDTEKIKLATSEGKKLAEDDIFSVSRKQKISSPIKNQNPEFLGSPKSKQNLRSNEEYKTEDFRDIPKIERLPEWNVIKEEIEAEKEIYSEHEMRKEDDLERIEKFKPKPPVIIQKKEEPSEKKKTKKSDEIEEELTKLQEQLNKLKQL